MKSISQPAHQNLAAGTASASSIVSALDLKREKLLFQNLQATPGMKKMQAHLPFKILYAEGLLP